MFEPPNLAEQLLRGRGLKRQVQSDTPAEAFQKASTLSASDETMTAETRDATPTPTVATETPETRDQPAPLPQIFDEGTTPTTTLFQMFDRNHGTRRKADQFGTPGTRTRLITKQSPEQSPEQSPNMLLSWSMQSLNLLMAEVL